MMVWFFMRYVLSWVTGPISSLHFRCTCCDPANVLAQQMLPEEEIALLVVFENWQRKEEPHYARSKMEQRKLPRLTTMCSNALQNLWKTPYVVKCHVINCSIGNTLKWQSCSNGKYATERLYGVAKRSCTYRIPKAELVEGSGNLDWSELSQEKERAVQTMREKW